MWLSSSLNTEKGQKYYLLQALYNWLEEENLTPHLIISYPKNGWVTGVPERLLQDERLVLNISSTATRNLQIDRDFISFGTRFSGQEHQVYVYLEAIEALLARENSQGIRFELGDNFSKQKPEKASASPEKKADKGIFKILK